MNGIMISRLACCVALVTAAAGCYRPDDYLLGPSQADQVLVVTVSATTVSADGISRVTITAQLDPRTDAHAQAVQALQGGICHAGVCDGVAVPVLAAAGDGQGLVERHEGLAAAARSVE